MTSSISRSLLSAHALVIFVLLTFVSAQQCYYPNGDLTKENDIPCGEATGACCPQGWQCSSIGLCWDPTNQYWGRYTCTDKSWGSTCPDACTHNGKVNGNEAILWCSDQDHMCCDGNRSSDCCTVDQTNTDVWLTYLATPDTYAPMGSPPSASTSASSSAKSSTPTTSSAASSTTSAANPSTSSRTSSVTTQSTTASTTSSPGTTIAGPPVVISSSPTPSSEQGPSTRTSSSTKGTSTVHTDGSSPAPSSSSSEKLGMIIGLAAGIPLALLAAGLFGLACWRRRRKEKKDNDAASTHPFYSGLPTAEKVLEIPGRGPPTETKGPAEMDGSDTYMQRYPVKGPNPFQNQPDLTEPPEHNAIWSRETTMMTLPGAVNSGPDSISPDMANFTPPYSPVSSQSASYRPSSYSEFSPTAGQGAWGPDGGIRPVEMEGSRMPSTIAELPASTPPTHPS